MIQCENTTRALLYFSSSSSSSSSCDGSFVCKMPAFIPKGHYNRNGVKAQRTGVLDPNTAVGESFDIVLCPKGTYNTGAQHTSYTQCTACPAGRYSSKAGEDSPRCSGPCFPGFYCKEGTLDNQMINCPAGTYGSSSGLKTAECDGLCPRGYYCRAGTAKPAVKCYGGHYGTLPPRAACPLLHLPTDRPTAPPSFCTS